MDIVVCYGFYNILRKNDFLYLSISKTVQSQVLFDTDGKWELYAQGALMLLKDHKRKTYFLILSSSTGEVLWTQEIYHRCNFSHVGKFIQFSGDDCQVGLNFENDADGIRFGNKMVKRSHGTTELIIIYVNLNKQNGGQKSAKVEVGLND